MSDTNQVILTGRSGADVVLRYTPSNMAVANLSLAVNKGTKDKAGNWENRTSWFKCVGLGKVAERCEAIKKGDCIILTGELNQNKWKDKEGRDRDSVEVLIRTIDKVEKIQVKSSSQSHPAPMDDIAF